MRQDRQLGSGEMKVIDSYCVLCKAIRKQPDSLIHCNYHLLLLEANSAYLRNESAQLSVQLSSLLDKTEWIERTEQGKKTWKLCPFSRVPAKHEQPKVTNSEKDYLNVLERGKKEKFEGKKRGIKIWFVIVVNYFDMCTTLWCWTLAHLKWLSWIINRKLSLAFSWSSDGESNPLTESELKMWL